MSPVKLLAVVPLLAAGSCVLAGCRVQGMESVQPEVVEEKEQVFVCTDKYGTSQERFGVRAAIRQDQMWHVAFDDDKSGTYLQMHGEWCYVLPVEVKEEK